MLYVSIVYICIYEIIYVQSGNTPLSLASEKGRPDVCEFLIEAGANKEHANEVGNI